nr:WYL domain-containing protein [Clostridia bacterium]
MSNETENNLNKARLITLLKMLYEKTDDQNELTTYQILDNLRNQNIHSNDKTLRKDIATLKELGFDVIVEHSKPNRYHIGDRGFDLAEVKLLIDAVASSRFVTETKSRELAEKLAKLASENQRPQLIRHIHATNRIKSDNPENFYNVDVVNEAINNRKKIAFKYTEYNRYKEKVFRNHGEVYELSPYALFWNEDYYYVVGWSDKHGNVSVFRTDRLYKVEILDEDAVPEPRNFNLEDYSKQIFEMFNGEEVDVVLECKNEFMKYIIDRFGEDVDAEPVSRTTFEAKVRVALSPTFYAWVFTFAGGIRIISPDQAVDDIVNMAKKLVKAEKK